MAARLAVPILLVWLAAMMNPEPLDALSHGLGKKPRMMQDPMREPDRGGEMIRPSGLRAIFPHEARCPEIASPFGSRTRYDGSPRPRWAPGGGYHGGIDITLADGTPLLALAAGTVVSKGEGAQMEGIYLWLRHSPEDTGLAYWVYSKYQHLQSLPQMPIGATVAVGQVIGRSGKTGTTGGHYGAYGYPHLHLTTRKSPTGEHQMTGSGLPAPGSPLFDPLVIYRDTRVALPTSVDSALGKDEVSISYATPDGQIRPVGARVVWPVACEPVR